jgi:hypothetical protein
LAEEEMKNKDEILVITKAVLYAKDMEYDVKISKVSEEE